MRPSAFPWCVKCLIVQLGRHADGLSVEQKRKEHTFRRQYNDKPSIIPGCPGIRPLSIASRAMCWHFFVDCAYGCRVVQTRQQRAQLTYCAVMLVQTPPLLVCCDGRTSVQDNSCRLSTPSSISHCDHSFINQSSNESTTQSINH